MEPFELPFGEGRLRISPSKIIGLVRTYPSHAAEMGSGRPERLWFFLKPPSSLLPPDSTILLPSSVGEAHHEVELAVIVGRRGKDIRRGEGLNHILGYTIMLDITARELQAEAKRERMPWGAPKGFDTFAPLGPKVVPRDELDPGDLEIGLKVNGQVRQRGRTSEMLFTVGEVVEELSRIMTLQEGDIIATGTPSGVGPIEEGDVIEAWIEGIGTLTESVERLR